MNGRSRNALMGIGLATLLGCESDPPRTIVQNNIPQGSTYKLSEIHTFGSGNVYALEIIGPTGAILLHTDVRGGCPPIEIRTPEGISGAIKNTGGKGGSSCDIYYQESPSP